MTYLDNDGIQKVKLSFDVSAKLSDTLKKLHPELYGDYKYSDEKYLPAKFYVDGYYANDASFELKLQKVSLNFTDNDGNASTLEKANEEILFFETPGSNTKKSTEVNAPKGKFYIGKSAFDEGKASAEVFFNFARKINHAKNPFTVLSDDFEFDKLSDGSQRANGSAYAAPAKKHRQISTTAGYIRRIMKGQLLALRLKFTTVHIVMDAIKFIYEKWRGTVGNLPVDHFVVYKPQLTMLACFSLVILVL